MTSLNVVLKISMEDKLDENNFKEKDLLLFVLWRDDIIDFFDIQNLIKHWEKRYRADVNISVHSLDSFANKGGMILHTALNMAELKDIIYKEHRRPENW